MTENFNPNRKSREPFFNFTEPLPAYTAGILIALFLALQFIPALWRVMGPLVILRPLGFQGTSLPEQLFTLLGHGAAHGSFTHVLMNAGMISVLGVATVKGARLKAISAGRSRSAKLSFLTIFFFGIITGGLAQWLYWFVVSAPLGINAPAAVGASGGASALLAVAGWAIGGKDQMMKFGFGWAAINLIMVLVGPYMGLSLAWAAHLGGFIGGMILAAPLVKPSSTGLGL
ncbi:rhomboid family intramembrane serine protease [Litorimonas haliclonae]|uniref:rhomboid family intramembrane serine protease n=1 Tax=Litorimonas haliclonae TaxID=2081977 RepID=UPI0039EE12C4